MHSIHERIGMISETTKFDDINSIYLLFGVFQLLILQLLLIIVMASQMASLADG